MALVGYSDSEDSEIEEKKAPALKLPAPKHTKPALQKVVDRSNPGKIRVSLPDVNVNTRDIEDNTDGPQGKRPRLGGEEGGIRNFNSLLPSPKRAAPPTTDGVKRGLGKGVNLQTSATPGFSRRNQEDVTPNEEIGVIEEEKDDSEAAIMKSFLTEGQHVESQKNNMNNDHVVKKSALTFKPLSVMRKPVKKKPMTALTAPVPIAPQSKLEPIAPTKVSLFSLGGGEEQANAPFTSNSKTQPYSYETIKEPDAETEPSSYVPGYAETPQSYINQQSDVYQSAQSLDSIASDLNLSASARRQLLGRGKQNGVATNIVNFNTDQEYAANEALRQAGEVQSHNPVRAIASGKHSLKQLVNAAANQKDALEEQFASGRRNKKEAGNKYGW